MHIESLTDSQGNTLSLARQVPSYGYELTLTSKSGTTVTFKLAADNMKALAEKLGSAAEFAEKFGR